MSAIIVLDTKRQRQKKKYSRDEEELQNRVFKIEKEKYSDKSLLRNFNTPTLRPCGQFILITSKTLNKIIHSLPLYARYDPLALVVAIYYAMYITVQHMEKIMHGHDRHNTTILSIVHNMSTTCFGQYYFWPSSGWIQQPEKTTQYNTIQCNHQCWCK